MKKKLILLLLSLALTLSFAVGASAEEADTGRCGENLTWQYDSGVLTVSGEGAPTTNPGEPAPSNGWIWIVVAVVAVAAVAVVVVVVLKKKNGTK
jgi:hypothetical protein